MDSTESIPSNVQNSQQDQSQLKPTQQQQNGEAATTTTTTTSETEEKKAKDVDFEHICLEVLAAYKQGREHCKMIANAKEKNKPLDIELRKKLAYFLNEFFWLNHNPFTTPPIIPVSSYLRYKDMILPIVHEVIDVNPQRKVTYTVEPALRDSDGCSEHWRAHVGNDDDPYARPGHNTEEFSPYWLIMGTAVLYEETKVLPQPSFFAEIAQICGSDRGGIPSKSKDFLRWIFEDFFVLPVPKQKEDEKEEEKVEKKVEKKKEKDKKK